MDIPINVDVFCDGEVCGRSICLIVNPVNESVTHLVVAEKDFPNIKRLVPVSKVVNKTMPPESRSIQLKCHASDLSNMETFEETDFIDSGKLESTLPYEVPYAVWPYGMYEAIPMPIEHERVPAGEVAIRRGTPVKATDGQVGKVDEFLVDPKDDTITHLVLREGHLWDQMDVTIPLSKIDKITEDGVYLKMDKEAIDKLPAISVKRKWK